MPPAWQDPIPPFLDRTPPSWAAHSLAWVLLALFGAALVAALVVTVPETVSVPFVLVPRQGADHLRASRDGVVVEIRAAEAQAVRATDVLFVLRSAAIGDRSAELHALETGIQGTTDRLANERRRHESQLRADDEERARLRTRLAYLVQKLDEQEALQTARRERFRATLSIYQNEIEITRREIEFKQSAFAVARELADRLEQYHKGGFISWLEYSHRKLEASKLAADLQQLDRQLDTARLKVSQLESDEQRQQIEFGLTRSQLETERREVQAGLDKLQYEIAGRQAEFAELARSLHEQNARSTIRTVALRAELERSRGNELLVMAPCAGTLLRRAVQRPGAVVREGETLAELACGDAGLHAELAMPPSSAGQVKAGQPVKLRYDSFPYQRHGVRRATVRWVSPTTVGANFRVFADIEDTAIVILGEPRPLTAGMGGRADVVVGRQTLIAYAFQPLRQLRESLADAPPAAGRGAQP
jgi:multidrug efflux pump subunit AcrA (membrane-fusion protein)